MLIRELLGPLKECVEGILQRTRESTHGWRDLWKDISFRGYDQRGFRCVDYGNKEMARLLGACMILDVDLDRLMGELGQFFSSLDKFNHDLSDHAIEMQGDVVEIFMAALRNDCPEAPIRSAPCLPRLFEKFCRVMQAVQFFDGTLCTGYIKYRQERVVPLSFVCTDPIVQFQGLWCTQCNHDGCMLLATLSGA